MRHRVADKKFNRTSNERKALFSGLLRNLTEHGEIVTTLAKAKAVKRLADRMVSQAKANTVATRRLLHKRFGKRDVVSTLVEKVAPAMADRTSGFVSLTVIGPRRGDNTLINPQPKTASEKAPKKAAEKKTAEKKVEKKSAEKKTVKKTVKKADA
jgi:large subunit ribosomal protein L17